MRKPTAQAIAAQLQYGERFAAEKTRQQRRYSDALHLWRSCEETRCRRHRRCCGDADACLGTAVALDRVPRRRAIEIRQQILGTTPRNIGAPERAVRQCMPLDFYLGRGR